MFEQSQRSSSKKNRSLSDLDKTKSSSSGGVGSDDTEKGSRWVLVSVVAVAVASLSAIRTARGKEELARTRGDKDKNPKSDHESGHQ
jgi:hypothetical protein